MGRRVFETNRWLEDRIRQDPGLLDGRQVGGECHRNVADLYAEWLERVEAETGFPQADPRRGFRAAVEKCIKRIEAKGMQR